MTCIAWDGKTLAADNYGVHGGHFIGVRKIFKVCTDKAQSLVAFAGNISRGHEMLEWYRQGAKPETFPEWQRDDDKGCSLLVIDAATLRVFCYEGSPHPYEIYTKYVSIGSGADFALAAMYLGKAAAVAVKCAIDLCPGCGGSVDVMTIKQPRKTNGR